MSDQATRLRELVQKKPVKTNKHPSGLRVIAIASGKGGVGKSNVVINLAIALAKLDYRVVVFDADLGLANVDVLLGMVPQYTLYDILNGQRTLDEVIINGPAGIRVVPGGSGIQELANLDYYQREQLVRGLSHFEDTADFLLIDTGGGISREVLSFVSAADEVLVVTTPEPTSITDAYGIIKIMSRFKVQQDIYLVVNRVTSVAEGQQTAAKLETAAKRFLQVRLAVLGYIAEDRAVGKAVMQQQPLCMAYPHSQAAIDIKQIAAHLVGGAGSNPRGMGGFMDRLLRLFG